eukprot:5425858-Pleurochrysis_carterae.AAC.1
MRSKPKHLVAPYLALTAAAHPSAVADSRLRGPLRTSARVYAPFLCCGGSTRDCTPRPSHSY